MAKVIQILDSNSYGHQVRLDDGSIRWIPWSSKPTEVGLEIRAPSVEFLNSEAQVTANILSEIAEPHHAGRK